MSGFLTDLADVLRAAGLKVVEVDGWKSRGRRGLPYGPGRPTHVMWHHTASKTTAATDVNLMTFVLTFAPIANLYFARDGAVWVMAAGPTNTNGRGTSAAWGSPVPDNSMNSHAIGCEIGNSGVGEPYPVAQQNAVFTAGVALSERYGIPPGYHRAHFEWSPNRKIDPYGPSRWSSNLNTYWDMDLFRAQLAEALAMPDPEEGEEMAYLAIPPPERAGKPYLYVSSSVRPATTFDIEDGVPQRKMEQIPEKYRVGQYDALHKAAGLG